MCVCSRSHFSSVVVIALAVAFVVCTAVGVEYMLAVEVCPVVIFSISCNSLGSAVAFPPILLPDTAHINFHVAVDKSMISIGSVGALCPRA